MVAARRSYHNTRSCDVLLNEVLRSEIVQKVLQSDVPVLFADFVSNQLLKLFTGGVTDSFEEVDEVVLAAEAFSEAALAGVERALGFDFGK